MYHFRWQFQVVAQVANTLRQTQGLNVCTECMVTGYASFPKAIRPIRILPVPISIRCQFATKYTSDSGVRSTHSLHAPLRITSRLNLANQPDGQLHSSNRFQLEHHVGIPSIPSKRASQGFSAVCSTFNSVNVSLGSLKMLARYSCCKGLSNEARAPHCIPLHQCAQLSVL